MHVRGQIRERLRELLTTIPGLETSVVFDSDEIPSDFDLPWCCVSIGDEEIEHDDLGGTSGARLKRDVEVNADLYYRARSDALLAAEEYAAAIETKVATDDTILDLVRCLYLQRMAVTRDSEGSQTTIQLRLQWLVTYSTNERDPTVSIP
jgi:hypothetical protein